MTFVVDLDGTLIDSTARHHVLMKKLLTEKGLVDGFDARGFMDFKAKGNPGISYLTKVLGLEEAVAKEVLAAWGKAIETEEYIRLDVLYEDAVPFLEKCLESGHEVYYLSARQDSELLVKELKILGIYDYAKEVIVVDPACAGEKKQQAVRKLLDTGISHEDILMVGDSENEWKTAQAVGVQAIILNRGFRNGNYWDRLGVASLSGLDEIEI
ncbi:MAG: HAD family hydrolase [Pseudobutyrivibrio sp.]|nr:HAD family hydrolase [Pseudobutyrivibrio sp.]MCF0186255.1 HAD family hydrolase [Bacteroidaceae bacterium]